MEPKNHTGNSRRFRVNSLSNRYIIVTGIVSVFLVVSAYIGWDYVKRINTNQLAHIQYRAEANHSVSNIILQSNKIDTNLQRFITFPSEEKRQLLERSFELYKSSIAALKENKWINSDESIIEIVNAIERDEARLRGETGKLIEVRLDSLQWFPAMNVMNETMYDSNLAFKSAIDMAIKEITEAEINNSNIKIYQLLMDAKYNWSQIISEFRLFVSNSFGVFSDPIDGMKTRETNITIYLDGLNKQIEKLLEYREAGELGGYSDIAIDDIIQAKNEWLKGYRSVLTSSKNEFWRKDLVLMAENIDPVFERTRQRLSSLQLELNIASARDITNLSDVSEYLSDFLIIISITTISIIIIGFLAFHRTILSPIGKVAEAIMDEAQGKTNFHVPTNKAIEIRQLTDAFSNMRQQIRNRQEHLDHLAHHDPLTQLPNRILFRDRLERAISRAGRSNDMVGLMFLDLDRFKQINDSLGHDIGDVLLQNVAKRILKTVRGTDTVARLGGDEFAIIIESISDPNQVAQLARKILSEFKSPFFINNNELHSSTSIGIALGPEQGKSADDFIKDADIAMYHAKELGRNNYIFYSAEMAEKVARNQVMETSMRHAIENMEFRVLYQPIYDMHQQRIKSAEALLRWAHPEKGLLKPAEFLPVLEESGLIKPVTQWVLGEVIKQAKVIRNGGLSDFRISVNISGVVFKKHTILDIMMNSMRDMDLSPDAIIIEITEDTLLDDLNDAKPALRALQQMGAKIALDDFGTGQSSLNHLRNNPIDIVKVDCDFIKDIPGNEGDSDLVDAIIAMAHKLHLKVIAEGVENPEQLEFLRWHNCDGIQGYLLSKPISFDEICDLISNAQQTKMAL